MITEREQKTLQLAKKIFEHFTQDALPIAWKNASSNKPSREQSDHLI